MNDTVTPAPATPMTGTALAERVEEVRTEVARAFIGQDEALDQAPKAVDGRFAVPRILGEAE